MEKTKVIVVETVKDMVAEFILATLLSVDDLEVHKNKILGPSEIENFAAGKKDNSPWVLILIGLRKDTEKIAQEWLKKNPEVVVLCIDVRSDLVNVELRNPAIDPLLNAVRQLLVRANADNGSRKARLTLPLAITDTGPPRIAGTMLQAALLWSRRVLRAAAERLMVSGAGKQATAVMTAAIADLTRKDEVKPRRGEMSRGLVAASRDFDTTIAQAQSSSDRLARLRLALKLRDAEFKFFCLVLAVEIDATLGRWLSLLQDDVTRKSANFATLAELIGDPATVTTAVFASGNLLRWNLIDTTGSRNWAPDDLLRIDPEIKAWLLGHVEDPELAASLAQFALPQTDEVTVTDVKLDLGLETLATTYTPTTGAQRGKCNLVICQDTDLVRAVIAQQADATGTIPRGLKLQPVKTETGTTNTAALERLTRRFVLTRELPVVFWPDASEDTSTVATDLTAMLLGMLSAAHVNSLTICHQQNAPAVLMKQRFDGVASVAISDEHLVLSRHLVSQVRRSNLILTEEDALSFVRNHNASFRDLNSTLTKHDNDKIAGLLGQAFDIKSLAAGIQDAKAQGHFSLAQRLTPTFSLDDVVLPLEQKQLLRSIANTVKHRCTVLDEWKFRDKANYGLGVVALFHGPSGTGKTMTAMALANDIGIGLLRIDMSQLVSKYIGETEKNIDQVFRESTRTGAAIMCDEVEALMSRRSEGNSAVERSFNMEVAYLLQRLEAHEGLVILTTNARSNIDTAFMRRIGYDLPFAKPDISARAKILTRCLPEKHHTLTDNQIMQFARVLNVPGGSLWQIVLRAAYAAAAEKTLIGVDHVEAASKAELARLGIPLSQIDSHELRRAA